MHTHVVPITRIPFRPAHRAAPDVAPDALATAVPELVGTELGFLNGHDVSELSALQVLPRGVEVGSLVLAMSRHSRWIEAHVARHASFEDEAFVALNMAFMEDGALAYMRRHMDMSERRGAGEGSGASAVVCPGGSRRPGGAIICRGRRHRPSEGAWLKRGVDPSRTDGLTQAYQERGATTSSPIAPRIGTRQEGSLRRGAQCIIDLQGV
jgi:SufBD protein N-terminal region